MARTRLFRRYFVVYSALVTASLFLLGLMLMLFAANFIKNEKYKEMETYLGMAAAVTAESFSGENFGGAPSMIELTYNVVSSLVDGDVCLAGTDGTIIYYSSAGSPVPGGGKIPQQIISQTLPGGGFAGIDDMAGLYSKPRYTVGLPVHSGGTAIGVLFISCPTDELMDFLGEFIWMFLISAVGVLIASTIVVYFITARMIYPLKRMLEATASFSKGDFSKRVPVSGYDEIGQLSMAFNNMASSLSSTELTRRSFVANVSHELKTPMTTISGFVDGILDGTVPPEKHTQYLQTVSGECKRLSRLVRSMLDTSRIEAGEMRVQPVKLDISETIRQTVFSFERAIEEKNLEIRGLETDRIMVYADADLIHQVVYNLVENAVKFVNPGGYLSFSYNEDPGMTYVAIRNSGEGIPKDEIPLLFDRFYKSDRSRGLNISGAGLGLHIARSIIKYHKGDITVKSVPGEFTEFQFSLRLEAAGLRPETIFGNN